METGTKNIKEIDNSIKRIETLTNLYKKKRLTTEVYVMEMYKELMNLNSTRNYCEYLKRIGQL